MKWFFLILLGLVAFAGEMIFSEETTTLSWLSIDRVAGVVAYATFCLSLFAYWLASYFLEGATKDLGSDTAHAALMLSIGVYFIGVGVDAVISNDCGYSGPTGETNMELVGLLAVVTQYLRERGWCPELGYAFLLLGGGFSWPILTLFPARSSRQRRRR